jgi:hypothetical protein
MTEDNKQEVFKYEVVPYEQTSCCWLWNINPLSEYEVQRLCDENDHPILFRRANKNIKDDKPILFVSTLVKCEKSDYYQVYKSSYDDYIIITMTFKNITDMTTGLKSTEFIRGFICKENKEYKITDYSLKYLQLDQSSEYVGICYWTNINP